MGSEIHVADDLLRTKWKLRQPSSSSQAERRDKASKECDKAGRLEVDSWNRTPNLPFEFAFHSIRLLRLEDVKTDTVFDAGTQESHHEAKGWGVAELLYEMDDNKGNRSGNFAGKPRRGETDIVIEV